MRRVLRTWLSIATPLAGLALSWYVFAPNFKVMEFSGDYRSNALIDLARLGVWANRLLMSEGMKRYVDCSEKKYEYRQLSQWVPRFKSIGMELPADVRKPKEIMAAFEKADSEEHFLELLCGKKPEH